MTDKTPLVVQIEWNDFETARQLLGKHFEALSATEQHPDMAATELTVVTGESEVRPHLLVAAPDFLSHKRNWEPPLPTLIVLDKDDPRGQWNNDVVSAFRSLDYDIVGIVRGSRLFGEQLPDPDESALLEGVLKEAARKLLRKKLQEEGLSKPIGWKALLEETIDPGFVSLFADPATRQMASDLKRAILSVQRRLASERSFFDELRDSPLPLKEGEEGIDWEALARSEEDRRVRTRRIPSVLLLGETGTGKTLLARWIAESLLVGAENSLYRVNISAVGRELIDGELFGSVRGSYTDAQDSPGAFLANRGKVIFLDEIGDMLPEHQTRLLLYLDSGQVRPTGWNGNPFQAPSVVVAATNRPVRDWAQGDDERFRADLLHRFDRIVEIPPLRERRQDLRLLISLTLQADDVNPPKGRERTVERISLDAVSELESRPYPGNFRDLRTVLARAIERAEAEESRILCLRHLR
ncbi:sigma 54-interacting transcriptional regulator [Aminithiophilus ramosus]|uniref:Sigma 54-interacting transcriptional regulator n=2 Tax=Synergistales TaxID=649776 RepID=A0A9Q7EYK9_9BACT|nr:sigma 54-interacting transcriptional regulator [Aminithiophilus ramosus]QTX32126.1 sigma 54-interacting transcriptional regulator [Aminithiophilus ramosus]QVL35994.1 sigma 54-interacting transcriptional regulator [Synergistota bacterium]